MSNFLAQIILAARGRDTDNRGWTQLLIFLVMAVFWLIGGIAKARANKVKESDFSEEQPKEPTSTSRPPQRQPQLKIRRLDKLMPTAQAEPTYPKIVAQQLTAQKQPPKPALKPKIPSQLVAKKTTPAEPAAIPLLDFKDVDQLKKAILYREILGKPLALRQEAGAGM